MIISASRRTDIPAFYSDWFFKRLDESYVLVRNPVNPRNISRISLAAENVDGIVFWTKDPSPMLARLGRLKDYPYYFQFTLNPYGEDIEPGVPSKQRMIVPAFKRLSDAIGPHRVIWRYDPVILTDRYDMEYHIKYFEKLAQHLEGYNEVCTFSFLDIYRNTMRNMKGISVKEINDSEMHELAKAFAGIAKAYGMKLQTCAEAVELNKYGIPHARCVDDKLFERITGCRYRYSKDPNQRMECGCMKSVDIGAYDCCLHGCSYCYATHSPTLVALNTARHDVMSPMLVGKPEDYDRITERKNDSPVIRQQMMDI